MAPELDTPAATNGTAQVPEDTEALAKLGSCTEKIAQDGFVDVELGVPPPCAPTTTANQPGQKHPDELHADGRRLLRTVFILGFFTFGLPWLAVWALWPRPSCPRERGWWSANAWAAGLFLFLAVPLVIFLSIVAFDGLGCVKQACG